MRYLRNRRLLVVLGVLLAVLGVASWGSLYLTSRQIVVFSSSFPAPAAAPALHPTYSYQVSCPLGATLLPDKRFARLSLRQGQVVIRWQPTPAGFSSRPTSLTLSADLIGRFDDAKQAEQATRPGGPGGTVVTSSAVVLTDDWSARVATSIMRLPPGIATGFYVERMHLASTTVYGTGYCVLNVV